VATTQEATDYLRRLVATLRLTSYDALGAAADGSESKITI
jgi:hypothetical protein